MTGIAIDINDLDLDEAGMHHELVLTFHDGSASYILTDEELVDLMRKTRARWELTVNRAAGNR